MSLNDIHVTDTLCRLWDDKQNGTYKNQGTFMDILMENINFNKTDLKASCLKESSQFRAILKGMCKSVGIQKSNPIWQSIDTLDDKAASLWFKAMIAARSKDQTFFNSYFNLEELGLSRNNLTNVDVSKNTVLTGLFLSENKLTSLNVSHNTALSVLSLSENNLIYVDVRQNVALRDLGLSNNNLTDVDVSKNTRLKLLTLSNNPSLKKEEVKGVTSDMQVIW